MTHNKMVRNIMSFIFVIIVMQFAAEFVSADFCTIYGSISYKDGEPVELDTPIKVNYDYFGYTNTIYTGPMPLTNHYFYMFQCRQGQDNITINTMGEEKTIILDKGSIETNFTLSVAKPKDTSGPLPEEAIPQEKPSGSGGGGGGSGGPGSTSPDQKGYALPFKEVPVKKGDELKLWWREDWVDLSRFIFKVTKVKEDKVRLELENTRIDLNIGEATEVDLDEDGEAEIKMTLEKVQDGVAYVSAEIIFTSQGNIIPEKEVPQPSDGLEVRLDTPQRKDRNLMLGILIVVLIVILMLQIKIHKNEI